MIRGTFDAARRFEAYRLPEIFYVNPTLPAWFSEVVLRNLRVGPCLFTLHFWREGERSRWEVVNMAIDSGVAQEDVIQVMDEMAVISSRR